MKENTFYKNITDHLGNITDRFCHQSKMLIENQHREGIATNWIASTTNNSYKQITDSKYYFNHMLKDITANRRVININKTRFINDTGVRNIRNQPKRIKMKLLIFLFFIFQFNCSIADKDICVSTKFKILDNAEYSKYFLKPELSVKLEKRIFYNNFQVQLVEITKMATHTGFSKTYLEFSNNEVNEIGDLDISQVNKILTQHKIVTTP